MQTQGRLDRQGHRSIFPRLTYLPCVCICIYVTVQTYLLAFFICVTVVRTCISLRLPSRRTCEPGLSDRGCERQPEVLNSTSASNLSPTGVVCSQLVQTQSSIRLPLERTAQVGNWTRVYHYPLQA